MDQFKGWIKACPLLPGDIKGGKCVVVPVGDDLVIGSVRTILANNKVAITIEQSLNIIPVNAINELCVEFMSDKLKTLPLKHTQWGSAIANKEVNSGKLVSFVIKEVGNTSIAKVIHNKPRITIEDFNEHTYDAYKQGAEDQRIGKANLGMWRIWRDKLKIK